MLELPENWVSPSAEQSRMPFEEERKLRWDGTQLIDSILKTMQVNSEGRHLRQLPVGAHYYFQSFFVFRSFDQEKYEVVAIASVLLIMKVFDEARKLEHVIDAYCETRGIEITDQFERDNLRDQVIKCESLLTRILKFEFDPPTKPAFDFLEKLIRKIPDVAPPPDPIEGIKIVESVKFGAKISDMQLLSPSDTSVTSFPAERSPDDMAMFSDAGSSTAGRAPSSKRQNITSNMTNNPNMTIGGSSNSNMTIGGSSGSTAVPNSNNGGNNGMAANSGMSKGLSPGKKGSPQMQGGPGTVQTGNIQQGAQINPATGKPMVMNQGAGGKPGIQKKGDVHGALIPGQMKGQPIQGGLMKSQPGLQMGGVPGSGMQRSQPYGKNGVPGQNPGQHIPPGQVIGGKPGVQMGGKAGINPVTGAPVVPKATPTGASILEKNQIVFQNMQRQHQQEMQNLVSQQQQQAKSVPMTRGQHDLFLQQTQNLAAVHRQKQYDLLVQQRTQMEMMVRRKQQQEQQQKQVLALQKAAAAKKDDSDSDDDLVLTRRPKAKAPGMGQPATNMGANNGLGGDSNGLSMGSNSGLMGAVSSAGGSASSGAGTLVANNLSSGGVHSLGNLNAGMPMGRMNPPAPRVSNQVMGEIRLKSLQVLFDLYRGVIPLKYKPRLLALGCIKLSLKLVGKKFKQPGLATLDLEALDKRIYGADAASLKQLDALTNDLRKFFLFRVSLEGPPKG